MKKLYSFTDHPEHEEQLTAWRDKWIANAFSTKPMDDAECAHMCEAVCGLYEAANLPAPKNIVFASGPVTGAIAAGIAAGVYYLRDPVKSKGLFGREVSEFELRRSIPHAVAAFFGAPLSAENSDDATLAATLAATTLAATARTIEDTTSATTAGLVRFLVACGKRGTYLRNGGNQWSSWIAYLSFFRHVAKLPLDYTKWQHYETLAEAGPRFMHADFCIVSERPVVLMVDEQNRAHSQTGPYCRWADGVELWYWRGTQVPKEWILDPKGVDPRLALSHPNAEQRRACAEIVGWARVVELLKPVVVERDEDPEIGELLEVELEGEKCRFLRARCGTGRTFVLPVPREMKTALQANAWTYDEEDVNIKDLLDFKPEIRT